MLKTTIPALLLALAAASPLPAQALQKDIVLTSKLDPGTYTGYRGLWKFTLEKDRTVPGESNAGTITMDCKKDYQDKNLPGDQCVFAVLPTQVDNFSVKQGNKYVLMARTASDGRLSGVFTVTDQNGRGRRFYLHVVRTGSSPVIKLEAAGYVPEAGWAPPSVAGDAWLKVSSSGDAIDIGGVIYPN